jgi:hypothetical protein
MNGIEMGAALRVDRPMILFVYTLISSFFIFFI